LRRGDACRKLLPDPDFYIACIDESFAELRDAAGKAAAEPAADKSAGKPRKGKKT
jgi:diacylglycerol O-acyltransferase / wax synthase